MRTVKVDLPIHGSLAQHESSTLANYVTEVGTALQIMIKMSIVASSQGESIFAMNSRHVLYVRNEDTCLDYLHKEQKKLSRDQYIKFKEVILASCVVAGTLAQRQSQQNSEDNQQRGSRQQQGPRQQESRQLDSQQPQQRQNSGKEEQYLSSTPIPFIPIIRFDKEQGEDGSYKTSNNVPGSIPGASRFFSKEMDLEQGQFCPVKTNKELPK
uniref:(California timema) hypothetical protein n=1 Tax=Timema californicum TaxID=61474 RepID=A0A7R9IWX1_TIMCA|nr:unnamed protein product [Timema californicum]